MVEKDVLLKLPNCCYEAMIKKYSPFEGTAIEGTDMEDELHMVLDTGAGSNIKMKVLQRIGSLHLSKLGLDGLSSCQEKSWIQPCSLRIHQCSTMSNSVVWMC